MRTRIVVHAAINSYAGMLGTPLARRRWIRGRRGRRTGGVARSPNTQPVAR